MSKFFSCVSCGYHNPKPKNRKKITNPNILEYVVKTTKKNVQLKDIICGKCYSAAYRSISNNSKTSVHQVPSSSTSSNFQDDPDFELLNIETEKNILSPKSINLSISTTSKTHRRCTVCTKDGNAKTRLVVIPEEAVTQAFVERQIFISSKNRCCVKHLCGDYFTKDALFALKAVSNSTFLNRTDIYCLLERVRQLCKSSGKLNFDVPVGFTDEDYVRLTGVTQSQFDNLLSCLSSLRCTAVRSDRTCVAVLLVKLRTGLSNSILGTLFSLSKCQIQRAVHAARMALCEHFVPSHLGFNHISHHDFVINHTTPLARKLFSDNETSAIIVLDGTYIYIQKSASHTLQRKTYSIHKGRPLVKPMMVVGSDGYILSMLGPYYGGHKNNDAAITKHAILHNSENINHWLCQNDVLVVDRGFRDCTDFLQQHGYSVEMPHFLPKGKKQHSSFEANESRLVTKVRWVVESTNARLKQFRFFDKVVHNHLIPYIGDFLRIVCAICNCFRPALAARDPEGEVVAKQMLERAKLPNLVQQVVESENLILRRSVYKEIDAADDIGDFPRLSLDQLRDITLGVYQLKLAPHYKEEHLSADGTYMMYVCRDKPDLLRVKIQSRHSNSTLHTLWIQYSLNQVAGWYCTCKCGARVVGCCAHIASVLWYLCINRWTELPVTKPGKTSSILCASELPVSESDSDSDCQDSPMEE